MHRATSGWPRLIFLAVVLAAGGGAREASAAPPPDPVKVEDFRIGFQGRYKVGTWTPVWVLLRGGLNGFAGAVEVINPDESGVPTRSFQPVQVGPGASQRITLYVRPGSLDSNFATLRFHDKDGRRLPGEFVLGDQPGAKAPEPLGTDDYQVLTLGRVQGVNLIRGLPGFNANQAPNAPATNSRAREVVDTPVGVSEDYLPGRWIGYDSVDVVVLDTNDKAMLASVGSGRFEALRRWVERGGHLVVAVASNWQAVNDSPIAAMLPARVDAPTQLNPFESLESFTGGSHQVGFEATPMLVAKLDDIEARGGKVLATTASAPIVVRGTYGFGRVTVIGLDTDTKPFAGWPDRGLFFVKALDLKGTVGDITPQQGYSQARLIAQQFHDHATVLRTALDQFDGVTLVPFGWVAAFIALYILLIGPGDYLFLKKVVKRMELTWITFPVIVGVVSVLAYYAAYVAKGTDLRINQVDAVDVDPVDQVARGTSWINLFSPQNRDYQVGVTPLPPGQPASADPKAATAPAGSEVILSWFGAPESGLRGMNTRGQGGFGGSGYRYEPVGKFDELGDVRIGIWSTKAFLARWTTPVTGPVVEADLQPSGVDRLTGMITNRLPYPIRDCILAFGQQVYYNVGTIEPGASVTIENKQDRALAGQLSEQHNTFLPANAYGNQVERINRVNLVREMLFRESDTGDADLLPSRVHRDLDLTGQLALGRPMLVGTIDAPVTRLDLKDTPTPKVERTTVLRVVLPVPRDKPAAK